MRLTPECGKVTNRPSDLRGAPVGPRDAHALFAQTSLEQQHPDVVEERGLLLVEVASISCAVVGLSLADEDDPGCGEVAQQRPARDS